jgi:hypothetical protein
LARPALFGSSIKKKDMKRGGVPEKIYFGLSKLTLEKREEGSHAKVSIGSILHRRRNEGTYQRGWL